MIRALPFLLLAAPASASDPGLAALAARVDAQGSAGLAAAYAACLAGQGDVERTAALFTAKGWERIDDDEVGMVELHSAAAPYTVTLWIDAARCEVGSPSLGTGPAAQALRDLSLAAGTEMPEPVPETCGMWRLGGADVRILASPHSAECASDMSSATRFTFRAAP